MVVSDGEGRNQFATMSAARQELQALFGAAKSGDVAGMDRVVTLAEKGCGSRSEAVTGFKDGRGRHLLHFAAISNSLQAIEWVLSEASELLELADEEGVTPLALAVSQPALVAVEELLRRGAKASTYDKKGATPLHRAAAVEGGDKLLAVLKDAGCDVNSSAGMSGTPLHWAAGHLQGAGAVGKLLELGAVVDSTDSNNITPIILAAAAGSEASFLLLLRSEADLGHVLGGGATVAHICAERGALEALKAICGCDVGLRAAKSRDHDGRTAAGVAADNEYSACVDFLCSATGESRPEKQVVEVEVVPPRAPPTQQAKTQAALLKKRGNVAIAAADHAKAEAEYSAAIALDWTDKTFFSNRCAARLELGSLAAALEDADECVALDPKWPKSHFRRATALKALGDWEPASQAFWEALRLDPNNENLKTDLKEAVDQARAANSKKQQQPEDDAPSPTPPPS